MGGSRKLDYLFALSASLIAFVVYLATLCPTIYWLDSGELVTAAYTLGIPHPPGSPIWCVLVRLIMFVPVGNIAYRANLASALFSSAALFFLVLITIHIIGERTLVGRISALSAILVFAFTRSLWSQSVVSEVYTLNLLFGILCIWLALRWRDTKEKRLLFCLAYIYGLGLTNHYLHFLFAPILFLWVLIIEREIFKDPRSLAKLFGLFLLGLAFFLYLPIRSRANPPLDWGNPETLQGFLEHLRRKQYAGGVNVETAGGFYLPIGLSLSKPLEVIRTLARQFLIFPKILIREFHLYGALIGLVGALGLFKERRRDFYLVLIALSISGLGYGFLGKLELKPDDWMFGGHVPSFALFAIFLGYGINWMYKKFSAAFKPILIIFMIPPVFFFLIFQDAIRAGITLPMAMAEVSSSL